MNQIDYWFIDDHNGGIGDIFFLVAFPFLMGAILVAETIFVLAGENIWDYYGKMGRK